MRVDEVLSQIRDPVDGMASRQAAAAAMKQADFDRALVLLSIRENQGIKLLIKVTGPVSVLPASDGNDRLGLLRRRFTADRASQVYMARYLTRDEYTSLPETGPNSQAKCEKSHVDGMYVMKRETPVSAAPPTPLLVLSTRAGRKSHADGARPPRNDRGDGRSIGP